MLHDDGRKIVMSAREEGRNVGGHFSGFWVRENDVNDELKPLSSSAPSG